MKTILIEAVSNGWIVRPWSPNAAELFQKTNRSDIYVFTSLKDLTAALPALLDELHQKEPRE